VITTTNSDLVFSAVAAAYPRNIDQLNKYDWDFYIIGSSSSGEYKPYMFVPASSWLLKKELISEIGPWRSAFDCYAAPSQDFLFRAFKAKKNITFDPSISVFGILSYGRPDVYKNREYKENEFYYNQIVNNNKFREQILEKCVFRLSSDFDRSFFFLPPLSFIIKY
jgi:hypothetical protein